MRRRDLLRTGLGVWGLSLAGEIRLQANPKFTRDPFTLGVASGDPWPDSVVLWTRLAPDPLNGGGMSLDAVPVEWRVATDEGMTKIVSKGTAVASPVWAHSVHAEPRGLRPDRWYWYQFSVGHGANRVVSPVGRARTAPAASATNSRYRFAFVCCQKYESGYYTALDHLGEEDLDLVVHLGDYIYEKGPSESVRKMPLETSVTLEQYRTRYAFYKMDPTLQKVHARFPWALVPDDHEVENNYAGLIPQHERELATFPQRRTAAYRAYYEHMPLRSTAAPHGDSMKLYRTLRLGQLADMHLLDTRQYRSDQPCGDGTKPSCPARVGPSTMLGDEQQSWLFETMDARKARWNILAQQVIFGEIRIGDRFMMDKWDGYVAARRRLVDHLVDRKLVNTVVLSGDNHNNWAIDVRQNPDDERSPIAAAEFAGTSLTSGGDGRDQAPEYARILPGNPQIRFHNSNRGYVRCQLDPVQWTSEFRIVPYVSRPGAPIETRARFVVESGRPGMQVA